MNLLIVDQDGVGLALAWRSVLSGHAVRWFVRPAPTIKPDLGEGFEKIEKVANWMTHVKWADVVFATSNCFYMPALERVRKSGANYFGPSLASAKLEIDRAAGMAFLEKHGIDVPPYKTFKDLKEAEAYVWKHEKRWVFKTLGDNADKSLSYCSKSPADMIARLHLWQERGLDAKGDVMLQEFIDGVEVGVSRWMGSEGWVSPPNINFEHKKLMPSNYGPNTGEMGTVMAYERSEKLAQMVLDPLEDSLRAMGHTGDCDINCIVDESGKAWPLEFTNRPGWPAFNIMLAAHGGGCPIGWMADALKGKATLQVSYEVAVGVLIAAGDFPAKSKEPDKAVSLPIYGLHKGTLKHFAPQGVKVRTMPDMEGDKVVERAMWVTADDYVGVVTALGSSVSVAAKRAYSTVDKLYVPDMSVRDDIGECLEKALPTLHKSGIALGVNY